MARLGDLGLLDDEAFALAWIESRDRAHPRGEHALMLELRQKGLDATTIAAALPHDGCSSATRRRSGVSPTHALGVSVPTLSSPATASVPRSQAIWPAT